MIISVTNGKAVIPYSDKFPLELLSLFDVRRASTIEPVVCGGRLTFRILWQPPFDDLIWEITGTDKDGHPLVTRKAAENREQELLFAVLSRRSGQ